MPRVYKSKKPMKFQSRRHRAAYTSFYNKYVFGSSQAQRKAQAQAKMGYNTAAKKRMSGPRMRNGLYSNHYTRYTPASKPRGVSAHGVWSSRRPNRMYR